MGQINGHPREVFFESQDLQGTCHKSIASITLRSTSWALHVGEKGLNLDALPFLALCLAPLPFSNSLGFDWSGDEGLGVLDESSPFAGGEQCVLTKGNGCISHPFMESSRVAFPRLTDSSL
jgi:hypothetical protein